MSMSSCYDRVLNDSCIDWEKLKGSSVLVTGGTGLIGSVLVRSLLHANKKADAGIKISITARNINKVKNIFGSNSGINVIAADFTKDIAIEGQFDYIVHCAAVTESAKMCSNPVETIDTSYNGTKAMLELARTSGSRGMVYISSMEVYGVTDDSMNPISEDKLGKVDLGNVRSSYPESKRICELLCTSYASEYGVPVVNARLAQSFGPGVSCTESRVFAQFAKSIIKGEDIVLHTKGDSVGNYCDTTDTATAILCLLTKGSAGESYNICNETCARTIAEMASLCADDLAGGKIKVVFDIPEGNKFGYAPPTKMRLTSEKMRDLGWSPEFSLEDMYRRMIEGWNEQV